MGKNIIHHSTLTRRVAGSRATEFIVAVFTLHHEGTATAVSHTDEQVTLSLVGLRERHTIGLAERLQQICAGYILKTEVLGSTAMHKTSGVDATVCTIAGVDSLQHGTILGVSVADGATELIAQLRDVL